MTLTEEQRGTVAFDLEAARAGIAHYRIENPSNVDTESHLKDLVDQANLAEECLDEIERLRGDLGATEERVREFESHENQTHAILGAILGTDDTLENVAKRAMTRIAELEKWLKEERAGAIRTESYDHCEGMYRIDLPDAMIRAQQELREEGKIGNGDHIQVASPAGEATKSGGKTTHPTYNKLPQRQQRKKGSNTFFVIPDPHESASRKIEYNQFVIYFSNIIFYFVHLIPHLFILISRTIKHGTFRTGEGGEADKLFLNPIKQFTHGSVTLTTVNHVLGKTKLIGMDFLEHVDNGRIFGRRIGRHDYTFLVVKTPSTSNNAGMKRFNAINQYIITPESEKCLTHHHQIFSFKLMRMITHSNE